MTARRPTGPTYVETSALLSWLFGEARADPVDECFEVASALLTSALTMTEAERAIARGEALGDLSADEAAALRAALADLTDAWTVFDVTDDILRDARIRFPKEPVRTLDAIHLATARKAARRLPSLTVVSLDERVRENARMLSLAVAP